MYSTYGQRTVTAGEGNYPLGYCARDGVLTEQTGLLYMRARYYSPELMRFINEDIIVGDIGNSNSLNRYAYVEGNPVTMVDPFGLCAEKVKNFVTSLFAGVEYEVSKIYYDTLVGKLTDMLAAIGLSIKNDSNYFLTLYGMSDFNEQYRQETIVDKAVYQVPFNYGRLLTDFAALALSLKGLSLSESGIAFSVVGTGGSGGTASAITVPVGVVSVAGYVASVDIGIAAISNFISFFKEGVSVGGPKNKPSEGSAGSSVPDYGTFNNLPENQGYSSFRKLKKAIGSAGPGNDWHHIVEQAQIKLSGFESEMINNTSNVISIDHATHMKITGYYNSKAYDFTGGLSIREWLSGQSFEQQYEFGMKTLTEFGVFK